MIGEIRGTNDKGEMLRRASDLINTGNKFLLASLDPESGDINFVGHQLSSDQIQHVVLGLLDLYEEVSLKEYAQALLDLVLGKGK